MRHLRERGGSTLREQVKGKAAENFFLRTMELFAGDKLECPPWILGVKKSEETQDLQGIDFIVTTDVGDIYVQLKSSIGYAQRYMEKHADIPFEICIVVTEEADTHVSLFRKTRAVLAKRRQYLSRGIRERFVLSAPYLPRAIMYHTRGQKIRKGDRS